jgi:hypothetical protein
MSSVFVILVFYCTQSQRGTIFGAEISCFFVQVIQDDFVRLRRENELKTSASDLHLLLVLAR